MDTLIIGDSIVKYVSSQFDQHVTVSCFSGININRLSKKLNKNMVTGYDFIVLHVGIHNIGIMAPDDILRIMRGC